MDTYGLTAIKGKRDLKPQIHIKRLQETNKNKQKNTTKCAV